MTITFSHHPVNGIRMRVAEAGEPGRPLVVFCHGWPESWYSWRHQLDAVAAAGFHAVAPDMRGYGGTEAPAEVDQYTLLHLVGDIVELVHALGAKQAVVVGHDWGAPVAWHCALLRPDLFRAVAGMSVPYAPPGRTDLLTSLDKGGIKTFYMQYFQAPGVAEAELERDVRDTLARVYYSASGEGPEGKGFSVLAPGKGLLDNTVPPEGPLAWLSEADLDHYTGEFTRAGFRGGLNWYRNLRRNWEDTAGTPDEVTVPALMVSAEHDIFLPPATTRGMERVVPDLERHTVASCGHWTQQEKPDEVNALLLDWLARRFSGRIA
jgi:pimeloyl-ACP methyl ester carboxylesterase